MSDALLDVVRSGAARGEGEAAVLERVTRVCEAGGFDPAAYTEEGESALHLAAQADHAEVAAALVFAGVAVDARDNVGNTPMHDAAAMPSIRTYADALGPDYHHLVSVDGGTVIDNGLTAAAHDAGLLVAPWTIRADQLPPWASSMDGVLDVLVRDIGVDSITTDFPDIARAYLDRT